MLFTVFLGVISSWKQANEMLTTYNSIQSDFALFIRYVPMYRLALFVQ